jgi:ketosteroid isomerase-like protein
MASARDVVLAHYTALAARDRAAALATLAEDVDWELIGPPAIPFAGPRRGREAVADFFAAISRLVEIEEFALTRLIEDGDTIVALGHERFRVKATGRAWNAAWVQVHTVVAGKIVHFREYTDTAAIAAAFRGEGRPEP